MTKKQMTKKQMNEYLKMYGYISKMITTDACVFYENFCEANYEHNATEVHMRGIFRVYSLYGREVAMGLVLWLFILDMITEEETDLIWNWLTA